MGLPLEFIWLLLLLGVGVFALIIGNYLLKQRRIKRLQDPHRDHLKKRK